MPDDDAISQKAMEKRFPSSVLTLEVALILRRMWPIKCEEAREHTAKSHEAARFLFEGIAHY